MTNAKRIKIEDVIGHIAGLVLRVAFWSFAFGLGLMVLVGVLHAEMMWPLRTLSYRDAYGLAVLSNLLMRLLLLA